jgi:hypothetical protein
VRNLVDAIAKSRTAVLLAIAFATICAVPAHAQFGSLMGPLDGSFCKVKKNNVIQVDSWLSLKYDEEFVTNMTFRRLAELTKSKGFSSFVTEEYVCGTLLQNGSPVGRRCTIRAKMENIEEPLPELKPGQQRFSAAKEILRTEADAINFPKFSGLLNSGNKCAAPAE